MLAVSRSLAVGAALACACPGASAAPGGGAAERPGAEATIAIAGLPPLPPWRVLFEAARRRHVLWGDGAFPRDPGPAPGAGGDADPPVLVPAALLQEALGGEPPAGSSLASAILASRRASLVYRGLAGLDEATLAALSASPGLAKSIGECCADTFAAFGGRLRVRDARVATPAAFVPALLAAKGGRRALLHDALARLDGARLRFAIGGEGPARDAGIRALTAAVDLEPVWWGREARGYGRDEADAVRVLGLVRVDEAGRARSPRTVAFWQAVYEGTRAPPASTWAGRVASSRPFDARWIVEAIQQGGAAARETRLAQLALGQRVFTEPRDEALVDTVIAVQAMASLPALVLTLERLGVREPSLYAAAVAAARSSRDTLLLQAGLAVIERARFARTIDATQAAALVRSLVAAPWADEVALGPAADAWIRGTLLPALGGSAGAAGDAEDVVLLAMAGPRLGAAAPVVEWEGSRHRVDHAAGEMARLRRVRERQGGERLDAALAACASSATTCAAALRRALASIVYAAHLGDADGPALAGEDPSRRHDLGARPWALPEEDRDARGVWRVRGALLGLDQALALLSLRRPERDALPKAPPLFGPSQRRSLAAAAALLNPFDLHDEERDGLARAIARGRARVEALAAGCTDTGPVAEAAALDPWRASALRWLLDHDPPARRSFFSLVELLELGREDDRDWREWGGADPLAAGLQTVPPRPRSLDESDGRPPERALARGFADLNLRVAVFLAERALPSSLAPALVKRLLPGVVDDARPVGADDRLALEDEVRRIPDAAIEDAMASLVGDGPLQPAPEASR